MAALIQSDYAKGKKDAPNPCYAGEVVAVRASVALATTDLVLNNIIEMLPIPAGCTLVDAILDSDDLDSNASPTITLDVGVMSGDWGVNDNTRTCGAEVLSQVTTGQAGGVVRPTLATAFRIASLTTDSSIGVKIHAAPATAQAGTIGLTLLYRG